MLRDELERLKATINTTWVVAHNVDGSQTTGSLGDGAFIHGTLAEQPTTLDASNDGLLFYVNDYGHVVRYNASLNAWEFAPGDNGAGYFQDFAIAPQAPGWAVCDGSVASYLRVGSAALSTASITLPNLTASGYYRKSASGYTGALNASSGSTGTGTTGTGTTGTGTTGTGTTGTGTSGTENGSQNVHGLTADTQVPFSPHTHNIPGLSVPGLSVPGLSVPGLSVPGLGVGSLDMPYLGVLPYFRR